MNILHILDNAGVSCTLAKYQRAQGHQSKVITIDGFDKYGIYEFYKNYVINVAYDEFTKKCIEEGKSADILHIHSRADILLELYKKFGKSKKFILHYHGTDIRGLHKSKEAITPRRIIADIIIKSKRTALKIIGKFVPESQIRAEAQQCADAIIVSTPDLLPLVRNGYYLENPVDLDHFKPDNISSHQREALTFDTEVTNIDWSLKYCKKHGVNLDIEVHDRMESPIMFGDMPNFLKKYKVYIDIRYVNKTVLENLSKTALEALACGLQVLDHNLRYRTGLPPEHNPTNVVYKLSCIYSK